MKISTILSFTITPLMLTIYMIYEGNMLIQYIIAFIGSISTGVGLSILYRLIYEE